MQSRLIAKQQQCLLLQPCLIEKLGRTPSIFLQQLHYWLTTEKDIGKISQQKKWIYNSIKAWASQLCLSERQVSRVINYLKELKIILVAQLSQKKSDRTNWYTINYKALEIILSKIPLDSKEVDPSLELRINSSDSNLDKMSVSPRHNDKIYNKETEITSENKILSSEAKAPDKQKDYPQQVNFVKSEGDLKIKNNLVNELLEIWNQTAGQGSILIQPTKKRAQHLVAAFKSCFKSSLDQWKNFCHQITTSDFLMGRKFNSTFKASLDWILRFDVIKRILEGDFGIKLREFIHDSNLEEKSLEMLSQEIGSSDEPAETKELRRKILHKLGGTLYQSWFKNLTIVINEQDRGVCLQSQNQFIRDYIETHYLKDLRSLTPQVIHIFC